MGSSDSDYSPGLGQVLVGREGVFQGTRSKAAVPYIYPTGGSTSPKTMRSIFQWSDDEEEVSGYTSSITISSVQTNLGPVFAT